MSKAIRAGICVLCLGSLYAHATEASINFAFQRIADHNTVAPGKTTTFKGFGTPSLDNGKVAFIGVDTLSDHGIYFYDGNTITAEGDHG